MSAAAARSPTPSEPLADAAARLRIREDLKTTLIVEAAAGTGKTTALVSRIVAVLRKAPEDGGGTLDRIVAVTFTEKAAGEMKLRLRAEIERARSRIDAGPDERARLDEALAHLEAARIGTIHSFCADLLRERPVEARVDPLFQVAAVDQAEALFDQAFDAWFQRALNDPPEGVRRTLRRRPRGDAYGPRELLRDAASTLADHRDFTRPWRRDPFDRERAIDEILDRLGVLAELGASAERENDYLAQNLLVLDRYLAELRRREDVTGGRDYDGLEAELGELSRWKEWRWKGAGKGYGADLSRAEVLEKRDQVKAELDALLTRASADLAACLQRELRPPIEGYEALKARAGKLDFLDLLLRARDLIRSSRAVREELQARFSHLFVDEFQDTDPLQAEILLLLAADDPAETDWSKARPAPGKIFVVGDPKQSIYRFRRADVALYEATKARLVAEGASVLFLATSFRSAPSIQAAVNAAFAPLMPGESGVAASQAQYVALERFRSEPVEQPTVIALAVPRPYGEYGKLSDFKVRQSIPDAVGAFIHHVINGGRGGAPAVPSRERRWMVTERERPDARVPLEARHICLLFKRFQTYGEDTTRAYVRALEARRIPHVLVGGRSFHDREEVMAVRNALLAVEWPDDELSVYATLRGPLFALTDDVLLLYRDRFHRLHPLQRVDEKALDLAGGGGAPTSVDEGSAQPLQEVATALALLGQLHRERNRRPIADTIGRLLDETRAHAGIAIWPTGEQALANVLRVMDLGRRFETRGATSFRAFVERLEADRERGEAAEAPVVEEGTEGVRIMTVHRAKGLEFPVVILADPTAPTIHQTPSRYVDPELNLWAEPLAGCVPAELFERREEVRSRDREEAVRLAYVATTRARELLVVPAVGDARGIGGGRGGAQNGDGMSEGWLDVLHPVLYPAPSARRHAEPAPGCPTFGTDSVLERPARCEADEREAVAPGLHTPQRGDHRVVWWDPHTLELDREPEAGLRQQRILQADERGAGGTAGERSHEVWRTARDQAIRDGSVAAVRITTATALSNEAALAAAAQAAGSGGGAGGGDGLPGIAFEETAITREGRPSGKRFGTLVHAVLAEVDLRAGEAEVAAMAMAQARLLGAPAEEVEAAAASAREALGHPLLLRAAESATRGECERETPVLLRLEDGTIVEGVVDLAFRERVGDMGIWTVVDFKTGAGAGMARAAQEMQLRLYVRAISEATGERARGVVLKV